jgi:hypothetical protein
LAPLKERVDAERVTSGENEDSLFSATPGSTQVAGRCVLNWCIFLAVLVQSGSAFRTLVGLFQKRDAGRFGAKDWTGGERGDKGNVVTNLSPM